MSTVTSSLKQIPLNGGYFRSVSANIAGDCSGHLYSMTTITNGVASGPTLFPSAPAAYNGLLRDMGVQYVINGITYRRVQIVPAGAPGVSGSATGSADGDYNVGYIIIGRTGGTPSVFVRTG